MRIAMKIMAFTIAFNIAIGIITLAIPAFLESAATGGLTYDESQIGQISDLGGKVNPSGVVEDSGNAIYRLLDSINLGFITNILKFVENIAFGFIIVLKTLFDPMIRPENVELANFLFGDNNLNPGILKAAMTLIYTITVISIWTGKDFDES